MLPIAIVMNCFVRSKPSLLLLVRGSPALHANGRMAKSDQTAHGKLYQCHRVSMWFRLSPVADDGDSFDRFGEFESDGDIARIKTGFPEMDRSRS